MIEFKQNPKNFLDQKLTPKKCHDEFPNLQNSQRAVEDITHNKKGSQDMRVLPRYHESSDCFEYPKNPYLNQATQNNTCQIFATQNKISESKISKLPPKSFNHPRHFNSGVHPPPPHTHTHTYWGLNKTCLRDILLRKTHMPNNYTGK